MAGVPHAGRPSAAVLATLTAAALTAWPAHAADAAHPAVVELFQSQSCSACPPANANVMRLMDRPDVLALSWQVAYRDGRGWTDTFAQPAFSERQRAYARALHAEVDTPQVVVNGRAQAIGDRPGEVEALMAREDRGADGPRVRLERRRASVAGAGAGGVWLVRYDPRVVSVAVRGGENGGKTLPHRDVVRQLAWLGAWDGRPRSYALPPPVLPGLRTAVLVQAPDGGPVLAATRD